MISQINPSEFVLTLRLLDIRSKFYLISAMDGLKADQSGKKCFTVLDLKVRLVHVKLDPESNNIYAHSILILDFIHLRHCHLSWNVLLS